MKNKESKEKGFIMFYDNEPIVNRLPDDEAGKLFKALFQYSKETIVPDFEYSVALAMAFDVIKVSLDRSHELYVKKCEINKKNIEKRWTKAKKENTTVYDGIRPNTTEYECIRSDTKRYETIPKIPIETEKVKVEEIEKEKVKETETEIKQNSNICSESVPGLASDLFSLSELMDIAVNNKIHISNLGIKIFYEEMQKSNWNLYGRPVEKENIVRVLRGYLKYNSNFSGEISEENNNEEEILTNEDLYGVDPEEQYRRFLAGELEFQKVEK